MKKYLLIIFLLLIACTPHEQGKETEVLFCPEDDCEAKFSELIESANESVYCALYNLELENLTRDMKTSSVRVKIVMDEDNYWENKELYEGIHVRYADTYALMHNKFCVIDKNAVITGSFNPTYRGNYKNNNNIVIVHSRYLAKNYMQEFSELWHNSEDKKVPYPKIIYNNKTIQNYFCPEDCHNVLDVIKKAEESIYFMTFSFTRDSIGKELIKAHRQGLDVKGVFEKTQDNKWLEYDKLKSAGINVRWDNNPANMHHKVFVIDNETVITGSMNPSNNGFERNDENVLILENPEIAKEFLEEFECIWESSG